MTTDATGNDELDALAGEYVLGTLDGPARRALEQRLVADGRLRAAVDGWQSRLLPLVALARPVDPPMALWERIEQGLPRPNAALPRPAPKRPIWNAWWMSLPLWRGLSAAGLAAALLLGIRTGMTPTGGATPQYVVVLVAPGGQAPGWVVRVTSPRELSLTPLATTATPEDRALQFWTKADHWTAPVSLGLVKPGEPLRVRLDELPALQPNQLFEITLEPPSGSPTGRPTGPIQFIGRAVKLSS